MKAALRLLSCIVLLFAFASCQEDPQSAEPDLQDSSWIRYDFAMGEEVLVSFTAHIADHRSSDIITWDFGDSSYSQSNDTLVNHTYSSRDSFTVLVCAQRHLDSLPYFEDSIRIGLIRAAISTDELQQTKGVSVVLYADLLDYGDFATVDLKTKDSLWNGVIEDKGERRTEFDEVITWENEISLKMSTDGLRILVGEASAHRSFASMTTLTRAGHTLSFKELPLLSVNDSEFVYGVNGPATAFHFTHCSAYIDYRHDTDVIVEAPLWTSVRLPPALRVRLRRQ